MSETENISTPPPNFFICDDDGLTLWRAEMDGISIRKVFNGFFIEVFRGAQRLSFTISGNEASHLSALLMKAGGTAE